MASDSSNIFERNAQENLCIEPNPNEFTSSHSKRKSRNAGGVRKVERRGKSVWVLDIRYVIADGPNQGKPARYRRDAEVQSAAGAKAELRRRLAALAATGSPFEIANPIVKAQLVAQSAEPLEPVFTFGDAIDEWVSDYLPTLKAATQYGYLSVARLYLEAFRDVPLKDFGAVHVRTAQKKHREAGKKAATINHTHACMRSVLNFALERKHLQAIPEMPSVSRVADPEIETYSDQEVHALIGACETTTERLIIMLVCYAGLRTAEVRGLRWRDIDLNRRTLTVRQTIARGPGKEGKGCALYIETPKSAKERSIPLHEALHRELAGMKQGEAKALICPYKDGKPFGSAGIYEVWDRIRIRANVRAVSRMVHAGRHYFGTALCRARVNVRAVQKLLGHADLKMTMRYVHAASKDLEEAIGDLEALTKGALTGKEKVTP